MADTSLSRGANDLRPAAQAAVTVGECWQMPDGRAAAYVTGTAAVLGATVQFRADGQHVMPKTAGVALLDGGCAYWDRSARTVTYRKVDDRDFYLGRIVGDAASAATTCTVNLNVNPPYDLDLARDPFGTTIIGTQALGGLALNRRGGAHNFVISSTNEAQKLDALSKDGFATGANAIVEIAFNVVSDGSGTVVDVSLGIASATHATDADSIAKHLFVHLDANNTAIRLQSKDGTTTVASTDTTKVYVEGAGNANRVEVWFDLRNPADVQVYVNAVNVLPATVFDVSASASTWYLLAHVEKTAAADAYEIDLEWLRARLAEQ